jgi:hypothetical protein
MNVSKDVVNSAAESIHVLKDENETKSANAIHQKGYLENTFARFLSSVTNLVSKIRDSLVR